MLSSTWAGAWLLAVAWVAVAEPARAEPVLTAGLEFGAPVQTTAGPGGGVAVRAGYRTYAPFLTATPELVFSYEQFSGSFDPTVWRTMVGLRLALGEAVRSGAFGHIGVGHIDTDVFGNTRSDCTYDLGVFLEVSVGRDVDLGANLGYSRLIGGAAALQWASAGLQTAVLF